MPIHQLKHLNTQQAYLIWNIQETEDELSNKFEPLPLEIELYRSFKHPKRRLEWLATRLAYQLLCEEMDIPYTSILKDVNGRPYLKNKNLHVALSHSFPYTIAAISQNKPIGVDIQIPNIKLQLIKEKYLNKSEIRDANQDLEKLCIYWCAKEAIYKAHEEKGLSFFKINIDPFKTSKQGNIYGQVFGNYHYRIHYWIEPNYILTWCQANEGN